MMHWSIITAKMGTYLVSALILFYHRIKRTSRDNEKILPFLLGITFSFGLALSVCFQIFILGAGLICNDCDFYRLHEFRNVVTILLVITEGLLIITMLFNAIFEKLFVGCRRTEERETQHLAQDFRYEVSAFHDQLERDEPGTELFYLDISDFDEPV